MLDLPARELLMMSLRRSSRGPGLAAARAGYAMAVLLPVAFAALVPVTSETDIEVVGRVLFKVQAALAIVVASAVVPAVVAQSVGEEARAGRLGLVVLAGRRSQHLVEGLVAGEVLTILGVMAAGVPVGLATSALGGVAAGEMALVAGVTIALAAVGGAMGALIGLSNSPAPTVLAVSGSVATALGAGALTWHLEPSLGLYAFGAGAGAALVTGGILIRAAARRLDAVGTARRRRRPAPARVTSSPASAPQTRCVPELWPLVEPGVRLAEPTWVALGLAASAVAGAAVTIAGAAQGKIDVVPAEHALAALGAVFAAAGLMLATWYPALRIATLVQPRALAMVAATSQEARRVLGAMQVSAAMLSCGVVGTAVVLLLPATLRRAPAWSSVGSALLVVASLQLFLLAAATLIGVDAPSVRRALGSATLLMLLGLAVWGAFWPRLLLGGAAPTGAALGLSAFLCFLASLAWSQSHHMFRGRWREPLGDLWRLRVW